MAEEAREIMQRRRQLLMEKQQQQEEQAQAPQPQEVEASVEPEEQPEQPTDGYMETSLEVDEDSRGLRDHVVDLGKGVGSGIQRGVDATLGMVEDGLEVAVDSISDGSRDPNRPGPYYSEDHEVDHDFSTASNLGAVPEAETTAGQLLSGLSQFATGFVGGGQALKGLNWTRQSRPLLRSMVQGGIADFAAFEENEQRLSNLIEDQAPGLSNPVTRFLAAEEDDDFFEGRLKNTIEGSGLGLTGEMLFRTARALKRGKRAAGVGDEADVLRAQEDLAEAHELILRQMDGENVGPPRSEGTDPNLTPGERARVLEESEVVSGSRRAEDFVLNDPSEVAEAQRLFRMASEEKIGWDEAFKFIPFRRPEKFNQFGDYLSVYSDRVGRVLRDRGHHEMGDAQSMSEVIRLAEANAATPEDTLLALQRFGKQKDDIAGLITGGRTIYEGAEQNVKNKVRAWKQGKASKEETLDAIDYFAGVQRALRNSQTTSGRALNAHKLTTNEGAAADSDRIAQVINNKNIYGNEEDFLDVLSRLPDDDAGVLKRVIDASYARQTWEFHNEIWINGLLAGPKTHVVNQTSNALQAVLAPIETAAGALVRGDSTTARATASAMGAIGQYTRDALRFSGRTLKSENPILDPLNSRRGNHLPTEDVGVNQITSRALGFVGEKAGSLAGETAGRAGRKVGEAAGGVIRMPSRALMTGDEFWKQLNYRSRLKSQAIDEAHRKGLSTRKTIDRGDGNLISEFDEYVAERFAAGFDEAGAAIDERALQWTREQTFTNDLLPNTIGKWFQDGIQKHPVLRNIMPFVRTPTNLVRQAWKRTPGLNLLQKEYREALRSPDHFRRSQAAGQMMSGGLVWASATMLAMNGQITGGGPKNSNMRSKLREQGWQPYSLRVGDKYYQFNRLDPMGIIFGIAGDYAEIGAELTDQQVEELTGAATLAAAKSIFSGEGEITGEQASAAAGQSIMAIPQNLTSKTYLKSLTDTLEAISSGDPEMGDQWFQSRVSSYVPNYLGQWERAQDPVLLETRTAFDQVKAAIPGMGDDLEPRRNVFGEEQMRSGSPLNRLLSSVAISERGDDPVIDEMIRLGNAFPPAPDERGNVKLYEFKDSEGQSAHSRWNDYIKDSGMKEELNELIQSSSYQSLSDGVKNVEQNYPGSKGHAMSRVINQYQKRAFHQFLRSEGDRFQSDSGLPISEAWQNEQINRARSRARDPEEGDLLPIK